MYIIPLKPDPNQVFRCQIPIDGGNRVLQFSLRYNQMAKYWTMGITDENGTLLVDSLPVITGEYPAANLLEQYQHLHIGSAVIVPVGHPKTAEPDDENLGSEFILVWGDTLA